MAQKLPKINSFVPASSEPFEPTTVPDHQLSLLDRTMKRDAQQFSKQVSRDQVSQVGRIQRHLDQEKKQKQQELMERRTA